MKNTAAGVPFILICVLLDILGIGLIIPVLPQLVGDLAGSQSAQAWWLGAMLVAYGLMQFCFAPTLGALSDRYGRRPVLLLGIFGLGIMFLVPALSQSLPVILFSRILGGMFAGNIAVAQAYISDVTDKAHRAAAFGKLGACFGIGFILGPALGGILGENDVRLPFFIAGCLSLLNFLYGIFVLPESLTTREHRAINFRRIRTLAGRPVHCPAIARHGETAPRETLHPIRDGQRRRAGRTGLLPGIHRPDGKFPDHSRRHHLLLQPLRNRMLCTRGRRSGDRPRGTGAVLTSGRNAVPAQPGSRPYIPGTAPRDNKKRPESHDSDLFLLSGNHPLQK